MTLPIPKSNPDIELKQPSEDEFNNLDTPEDEVLLATGAWEGDDENESEEE